MNIRPISRLNCVETICFNILILSNQFSHIGFCLIQIHCTGAGHRIYIYMKNIYHQTCCPLLNYWKIMIWRPWDKPLGCALSSEHSWIELLRCSIKVFIYLQKMLSQLYRIFNCIICLVSLSVVWVNMKKFHYCTHLF